MNNNEITQKIEDQKGLIIKAMTNLGELDETLEKLLRHLNANSIFFFTERKELVEIFKKHSKSLSGKLSEMYQINVLIDESDEGKKDLEKIADISEKHKEYSLMITSLYGPMPSELEKELLQNKCDVEAMREEMRNDELERITAAQKEIERLEKLF